MLKTTIATVGVILSTLPVLAEKTVIEHPSIRGQIPCRTFISKVEVLGKDHVAVFSEKTTIVKVGFDPKKGSEVIMMNGHQFASVEVIPTEDGLKCIGTPHDETGTASGR